MLSNTAKETQSVAGQLNTVAEQLGPQRIATMLVGATLAYCLLMIAEVWREEPLSPALQQAVAEEVRRLSVLIASQEEADRVLMQATVLATKMAAAMRWKVH